MTTYNDNHGFSSPEEEKAFAALANDLSWEQVREPILSGIAARNKKKRRFIWFFISLLVIATSIAYATILTQPVQELASFLIPMKGLQKGDQSVMDEQTPTDLNSQQAISDNALAITEEKKHQSMVVAKTAVETVAESGQLVQEKQGIQRSSVANVEVVKTNKPYVAKHSSSSGVVEEVPDLPFKPLRFNALGEEVDAESTMPPPVVDADSKWQLTLWLDANQHQTSYAPTSTALPPAEKTFFGQQGELRLSRKLKGQFTIGAGLRYQMLRTKAEASGTYSTNLYRPNTIDTIFTNLGTGEVTYSYTDSIPGLIEREFRHTNRQHSVQLPVLFGYSQQRGRLQWGAAVGVQFELYHRATGRKLLDTSENFEPVPAERWYNSARFASSVLLEASLRYQLTEEFTLATRLGYQSSLKDRAIPQLGTAEQVQTWYGGLGLQYAW